MVSKFGEICPNGFFPFPIGYKLYFFYDLISQG